MVSWNRSRWRLITISCAIVLPACEAPTTTAGETVGPEVSDGAIDGSAGAGTNDGQVEQRDGADGASTTGGGAGTNDGGVDAWNDGPGCSWPRLNHAEGCVLEDGKIVETPVVATVTVLAVDDIAPGACVFQGSNFDRGGGSTAGAELGKRLVLEAFDGKIRILNFRGPELPSNLVREGETLNLSLQIPSNSSSFFGPSQAFALTRDERVVLFAATLNVLASGSPRVPNFGVDDVRFGADGPLCVDTPSGLGCQTVQHRLRITVGADTVSTIPFQSGRLGALTYAVDGFYISSGGFCDAPSITQVAGYFTTPTP